MVIRKTSWRYKGVKRSAWRVDARSIGGKRVQFKTKREAELYRDKLIRERERDVYGVPTKGRTFFDLYQLYMKARDWRSENYRYRTKYTVEKNALVLQPIDLTELRPDHFESWKSERLNKAGRETVRVDLCVLSAILRYGVRIGWLRENPLKRVEFPRGDRLQDDPANYLSFEEVQEVILKAGKNAPVFQFAVATGLRVSEIVNLEWSHIKDGGITVASKGKKRTVPAIQQALDALGRVPRHVSSPKVFYWLRNREAAYLAFQKALRDAQVTHYRFHDLRHSYASWSAMAGCDLYALAKNMGISSLTVLKRYAHLSPTFRKSEADKLADFWGKKAANMTRKAPVQKAISQYARKCDGQTARTDEP